MSGGKPKLYCAWFCPFAQRPWIAFLHKGIDFDYIDQNPYNKTPEWLAINPDGKVPVIVHNGKTITESAICVEYIEETWPGGVSLLPKEPEQRAQAKTWCDYIEESIMPFFYLSLFKRTTEGQEKAKRDLLDNLKVLTNNMSTEGPYFLGGQFSMVDIMLIPFMHRSESVLKHYRGFEVPVNDQFARYHIWWKAVLDLGSVKPTLQDGNALIRVYKAYAGDQDAAPAKI